MSRQRSCSSATTSPICRRHFYNTLLESQRGNLSDAELRQKKMVTPFFIWANYDIMEQTNMQIERELSVRVCAERARLLDLGL